jgi:hypothetical protein
MKGSPYGLWRSTNRDERAGGVFLDFGLRQRNALQIQLHLFYDETTVCLFHKMGVIDFIKDIIRPGNGVDYPEPGDMVTVHYHGYLYDPTRSWNRGRRYARCVALY